MLTDNLLDAWLMNATGGSIDLLIGVTSSIPCLLRVKGRKGGSNLMGANVARVHRKPNRSRTAVASCDHGASLALPDRLQALLTMCVLMFQPPSGEEADCHARSAD
jgi:hypothetical protein